MIFSCIRLYYIHTMETSTDPDVNYSLTTVYSAIEVNMAIWAASTPALWPLIRGRTQRTQDDTRDYYGSQEPGSYGRIPGRVQTNERSHAGSSQSGELDFEMIGMT